ncbi:MAG: DUF4430 domain-containing protein [Oscillospiraceae bacterium]
MKKPIKLFICLLAVILLFSGCKIEKVEEVALETTASVIEESDSETIAETTALTNVTEKSSEFSQPKTTLAKEQTSQATSPKPIKEEQTINKEVLKYCYLSVDCKTILNNKDKFNKDKLSILPSDGVIFSQHKVVFNDGETVFDVLSRELRKNRIHMEFSKTPIYNSSYIEGIGNIYHFDCGELSGWMYSVNGVFPNYGVSRYKLSDGDKIEMKYSCDLGRDLGHEWDGVYHDE